MQQRSVGSLVIFALLGVLPLHCKSAAQQAITGTEDLQQKAPEPQGTEPYRLRTFVSRIQIPTLVLGRDRTPVPSLQDSSFSITLDSGPIFHPNHSRVEGDDPLSLSILIDATGSQPEITGGLADALAKLVPDSLHATDHVSIFAADCKMIRTRFYTAADSDDIRQGVNEALHAMHPPNTKKQSHCGQAFHLWDFATYMFGQTGNQPGRRVALIISAGHESQSSASLLGAVRFAAGHAISVFALRDREELGLVRMNPLSGFAEVIRTEQNEEPLDLLCASNGGLVFDIKPAELPKKLQEFLFLVRSRYILEFPRPDSGIPGWHAIDVTVPKNKRALVRAAGASVISADPNSANDPTVIPSQASPAVFGTRRPIGGASH